MVNFRVLVQFGVGTDIFSHGAKNLGTVRQRLGAALSGSLADGGQAAKSEMLWDSGLPNEFRA